MSSISKLWAPKCVMPDCNNRVGYHKKYDKLGDKGPGFKWKAACDYHRGVGKPLFDAWKLSKGCENTDAHHGFICTSTITSPEQLDVNHIDGNRHNNEPKNIECLCPVCHNRVTRDNGHQRNRYTNQVYLDPDLFEYPNA